MNQDSIVIYIQSGLENPSKPKQFREYVTGPFLLVMLMGIIPGVVLGDFWLVLSLLMVSTALTAMIAVFVLSTKELTIQNRLTMKSITYISWALQISLIQTMLYTMAYGFNLLLILIYLPPVAIPFGLGFWNAQRLKKGEPLTKNTTSQKLTLSFGWTATIGGGLAALSFENMSQQIAIIFTIVCLTFVSSVFSTGLISMQKLYYCIKLNNDKL